MAKLCADIEEKYKKNIPVAIHESAVIDKRFQSGSEASAEGMAARIISAAVSNAVILFRLRIFFIFFSVLPDLFNTPEYFTAIPQGCQISPCSEGVVSAAVE